MEKYMAENSLKQKCIHLQGEKSEFAEFNGGSQIIDHDGEVTVVGL